MIAHARGASNPHDELDALLGELDSAPQDEWARMARLAVFLALQAPEVQAGEADLQEALAAVSGASRRSYAMADLAMAEILAGRFAEAEAIATYGLEQAALGSTLYTPRLWWARAESARVTGRWDDAQEFLDRMEASLPAREPSVPEELRVLREDRARLIQARGQILLELGLLDQCGSLARAAIEAARASGEASALAAAQLLALDQEMMSSDAAAAVVRARECASDPGLAAWHPLFHLAEGIALVEEVREAVATGQDASELDASARTALESASLGELPLGERLKLEIGACDLELCTGRVPEARARFARARELVSGSSSLDTARETLLLASLAWHLAQGAAAEEVALARGGLFAAYERLLEQWRSTPRRPGGIGFLHLSWRAQILSDVIDAELGAGEPGVARAFGRLLDAQTMGTGAREHRLAGLDLAGVRSALLRPGRGLLVLLPARDRTHLFLLDPEVLVHDVIPFSRGALRDAAGGITSEFARPGGKVDLSALGRLHDRLLSPRVRKHLQAWSELITVGFDLQRDLPFGLLGAEGGKPYGRRLALVALPSIASGVELARRAPAPSPPPRDFVLVVAARPPAGPELEPFEFGRPERARWLAPYAAERVTVLEGPEATRAALLGSRELLAGTRVLQFLAHGTRLAERESTAALVLNADGEGTAAFTAEDVGGLRFGGLVILTACAAGRGPLRVGDDRQVNLGGAFLDAGASCVVLARFPIEYQATLALMERFHARLAAGESPAAALRSARASLAETSSSPALREAVFEVLGLGFEPALRR